LSNHNHDFGARGKNLCRTSLETLLAGAIPRGLALKKKVPSFFYKRIFQAQMPRPDNGRSVEAETAMAYFLSLLVIAGLIGL
jgi:hypothetical protein